MHAPRRQLTIPAPPPRPKPAAQAAAPRPAAAPARRRAFGLPEVREIPRRAAGGPWEAGW
ncbi:MAG TPA: hypothetical protein VI006_24955 [Solirubrobacteraceae bacterium]